jgi:NAD(P) transhydrogenase subunit alpha
MKPGSVIVDLAASTGGNCAFTENGKVIQHKGITIVGDSDLSRKQPQDASFLFANNLLNFLKLMIKEGAFVEEEHEILVASRLGA